ncbi:hypothetical protein KMU_35620 [Proteus vulgaris]|uniref:hypothetical protein n=1 Tax=Proteus vulgaris TaxID=585 RepID=UPI0025568B9F|nr:hypothetical protein [Proteus vulgaris]GLX65520.1 hypothetical protein KMU_35620 [Proteus vulgaris]
MAKSINLAGTYFASLTEAKEVIHDGVSKGDKIENGKKYEQLKELFVEYCNNDEEKWHVNIEDISHFEYAAKLTSSIEKQDIINENTCFWCIFYSDKPRRDFSVDKALRKLANFRNKNV